MRNAYLPPLTNRRVEAVLSSLVSCMVKPYVTMFLLNSWACVVSKPLIVCHVNRCILWTMFLCCSMASPSKFQGASGNLRRVFDQNQKRYRDLINSQATGASRELSPHHQRVRDIKSFCIKFLHLMDILYNLGGSKGTNRWFINVHLYCPWWFFFQTIIIERWIYMYKIPPNSGSSLVQVLQTVKSNGWWLLELFCMHM